MNKDGSKGSEIAARFSVYSSVALFVFVTLVRVIAYHIDRGTDPTLVQAQQVLLSAAVTSIVVDRALATKQGKNGNGTS